MTDPEALRAAFETRRPALEALGDWVIDQVHTGLVAVLGGDDNVAAVYQIPPKPRVKSTTSFLDKALVRKPKSDPLSEITDQVGVRFVVLLLEEIDVVGRIVQGLPWDVSKDRDYQQERHDRPDYFAYQSDHFVIRTRSPVEWNGVSIPVGTPCEIQVRTVLQHAYAQMAHATSYKPPVRLPEADARNVNRALAKGSALIETTDDVFRDIRMKLREHNERLETLLGVASTEYERILGEPQQPISHLGREIAEAYRGKLASINVEALRAWAADQHAIGGIIKAKRSQSIIFRDPVVLILAMLIERHRATLTAEWPFDGTLLEDLFVSLGYSTRIGF
jgi:ppGpp synthetase/RelA/SpoT-type nucleotidyltranferase